MWVCIFASDMQSQVFKYKCLSALDMMSSICKEPFLTINLLNKHTIHEDMEIWTTRAVCEKTHLVFIILTSVTSPLALNWSLSLSSVM